MQIPSEKGSYILVASITGIVTINSGMFAVNALTQGNYFYAGSALGAGGLRAKVSRHLRLDTKKNWHIDHLKEIIDIREIWFVVKNENLECQFIKTLQGLGECSFPIKEFGSSDCRCGCRAQLVKFPLDVEVRALSHYLEWKEFSVTIGFVE